MSVFVEISIKHLWDEEKGRAESAEGVGWDVETQHNEDKISGGSQSVGRGRGRGGAEQCGKERGERVWFLWEMLRVRVREVTGCHLLAGAKPCEALNSKGFELYSVGEGELTKVLSQGSDKGDFFFLK